MADSRHYPNLLVMRTLSKLGLAGLRLGLLAARPEWITHLEKLRLPYNVGIATQLIAAKVSAASRGSVATGRRDQAGAGHYECTTRGAGRHRGLSDGCKLHFIPGAEANGAGQVFQELKKQGILIKNLDGSHPLLKDCLRVTIGTPDENRQFLDCAASRA